uniref:Acyl-CoA_dh_N domain-containing protein n=1 Tax=Globodera pallida TaxID=36090 RepID=A0A183BWI1_GLOPA
CQQQRRAFAAAVPNEIPVEPNNGQKTETAKDAKPTESFCMNLFLGRAQLRQVFPYPLKLDDEQRETLQMVVTPSSKFLEEVNDPNRNDEQAQIPADVLAKFAELGAFGALVPEKWLGAGLNNTQMARMAELVGASDLGLGVTMGAHQPLRKKADAFTAKKEAKTPSETELSLIEQIAGQLRENQAMVQKHPIDL